jgi:hypothetical protein
VIGATAGTASSLRLVMMLDGETREIPQQSLGVSKRVHDEPRPDLGLERMKPKLE